MMKRFEQLGDENYAAHARCILECLKPGNVGVEIDGERLLWTFGLMSGWRHTMLLNILMNVCEGRVTARRIEKHLGIIRFLVQAVGGDGAEVWSHVLQSPIYCLATILWLRNMANRL